MSHIQTTSLGEMPDSSLKTRHLSTLLKVTRCPSFSSKGFYSWYYFCKVLGIGNILLQVQPLSIVINWQCLCCILRRELYQCTFEMVCTMEGTVGGRGEIGCWSCDFLWVDGLSFDKYFFIKVPLKSRITSLPFTCKIYFKRAFRFLKLFLKQSTPKGHFLGGHNFGI